MILGLPIEVAIRYVAAAYIGLWVAGRGYIVMMANQVAKLRREIKLLADMVAKRSA